MTPKCECGREMVLSSNENYYYCPPCEQKKRQQLKGEGVSLIGALGSARKAAEEALAGLRSWERRWAELRRRMDSGSVCGDASFVGGTNAMRQKVRYWMDELESEE